MGEWSGRQGDLRQEAFIFEVGFNLKVGEGVGEIRDVWWD
jgi:hypothetical protein